MGQACCQQDAAAINTTDGAEFSASTQGAQTGAQESRPPEPEPIPDKFKVCVVGGSGAIGQNLCLLLAMESRVKELVVFDLEDGPMPPAGVAADLSHLPSEARVTIHAAAKDEKAIDSAAACLSGCHLVMITAGAARQPGMSKKDFLSANVAIAANIVEACSKHCPDAIVAIMMNPLTSIVPAMGEVRRRMGLGPEKVLGITTLDCVRAETFASEAAKAGTGSIQGAARAEQVPVPVIGGHAGSAILPLFSQAAGLALSADQCSQLDLRVRDASQKVVSAMDGRGTASLSAAYAAARLGRTVLAGLAGEQPPPECAFVASSVTELPFFASPVTFGTGGIEQVHLPPLESMSAYEKERLEQLMPLLKADVFDGLSAAGS